MRASGRLARQRHRATAGARWATLTIRKFRKDKLTLDDLVRFGSITPEGARVLA